MRDQLFARALRRRAVEINFRLHQRAVGLVFEVDGDERRIQRQVALDERRYLATPDLRRDQRAWSHTTRQLEQPTAAATVVPVGTRTRLPPLVAVNLLPRARRMLDEPKVRRHVREARCARHVVAHVNDQRFRLRSLGAYRRRDGLGSARVRSPVRDGQDEHGAFARLVERGAFACSALAHFVQALARLVSAHLAAHAVILRESSDATLARARVCPAFADFAEGETRDVARRAGPRKLTCAQRHRRAHPLVSQQQLRGCCCLSRVARCDARARVCESLRVETLRPRYPVEHDDGQSALRRLCQRDTARLGQ